ncbi:MAG TPA: sialidase family protein [Mycobacteriales bacterium]|nr:sialidase family protein [Mycobacteriales bacterium]
MAVRRARLLVSAAAVAAVAAAVAPAHSAPARNAATFGKPVALPEFDGGEPSLAIDPTGNGGVYVVAPQGLGGGKGIGFWASHDHGRTFPVRRLIGSSAGGGDSDVEVGNDHTVYVADLELAANAICRSSDGGATFVDATSGQPCDGLVTSQYGYVSDRQWLNHGPAGELYLTYHDVHVELPYTLRSDDQGRTFVPCGPTSFSATGTELANFTPGPTSGTQVPKPVIDREGRIYTAFATATAPAQGGFDHLYLTTTSACSPASVFTTYPIYAHEGADLAQPFDGLGRDGGGTLYVVAGGHLTGSDTTDNVWLFRSDDGGKTWAKPVRVNTPGLKANMLPTVAGGLRRGQVAIGWYGAAGPSRSSAGNAWRYYVATSFDGGRTFTQAPVTGVMHKGAQARALLDFTTILVEPRTGAVIATFAGDADGKRKAYVVRQTGGRYLR